MGFKEQYGSLRIGDLQDLTTQIKAKQLLSKGLKEQKERMKREKIKKEILKSIFDD